MAARYILPALALTGAVLADSSCSGDLTISTTSDASAISSCTTYKGDITISSSATGTIELNGVQAINGDLTVNNATQLTALTSDQLNSISGTFTLTDLTILSTLQFDSLSAVNKIYWVGLPALQQLTFSQGISRANDIEISNTELSSLTGIELTAVGSMDVNNNPYLTTINVNDLTNVTDALVFAANGKDLEISFPNLESASNLTFRNVSSVSMPSLATVDGNLGFYSDTFESFAAPNLTYTKGLSVVDSPNLNNFSFPELVTIAGGLLIANNTNLKSITGFPKLKEISGALDFAGTFSAVSIPQLEDLKGGDNVQTTSTNSTICDVFAAAHSSGVIKGVNNCVVGTATPQTSDTSGSSSSSTTSKNAANAAVFDPSAPMTGVWAIIAAVLFI